MTPILTLWPSADTNLIASRSDDMIRSSDQSFNRLYDKILCNDMSAAELAGKISGCYRNLISLTMADTTLHIVGIVPLYHTQTISRIQLMTEACALCTDKISLHIIAMRAGLSCLTSSDDGVTAEYENITLLDKHSAERPFRYSYTIVDDYAANGAPIGFTIDSFSAYISLIISALIHNYHGVLPPALIAGKEGEYMSMGACRLQFDRENACEYLLHKAFLGALDDAGINSPTVDAQKASNRASELLHDIDKRYSDFYTRHVLPLTRDKKMNDGAVTAAIPGLLDSDINDIEQSLTSILNDSRYSYPEMEAILALILGRDNPRLEGVQYDRETALLDDACTNPVNLYIDGFNNESPFIEGLPTRGDFPGLKKYIRDSENKIVESPENLKAFDPLPELKRLKLEILNTTAFIRRKNEELQELTRADQQREAAEQDATPSHSRPGRRAEVREQPLDEVYTPPTDLKIKKAVDLRTFFSPIQDQQQLGACTSFAATSMYEAIMNRYADGVSKVDLSEMFIYYHSNILTGRPDGGSNYHEQLAVLGKYGICCEKLYGYSTSKHDNPPSQQAIEDALQHRVLKAMQIPLRTEGDKAGCLIENHRLLTSALSEGYPVGISLKIYNNFGHNGPFISRPDDDDIASGGEGYHAMVIAGYSETEKCYIVRNSWGERFGDKGYCYISAAYIDDPDLNPFSCIITETTDCLGNEAAEIPTVVARFAGTEAQIKIAAIRNILDEAHVILQSQTDLYDEHYRYYQQLMQSLGMPNVRNAIAKGAQATSAATFLDIANERQALENSFVSDLKEFKHKYIRTAIKVSAFALCLDLLTAYLSWPPFSEPYLWTMAIIVTLITVVIWVNYRWSIRRKRKELNDRLADLAQSENLAQINFKEKKLQFHVAGMWIDRMHTLSLNIGKTYDRLVSYNGRLREWYDDDTRHINNRPAHDGAMFINIGSTALLDNYFASNRDLIISNIDLMDTFKEYAVDRETIQAARQRLRQNTMKAICPLFADFRMVELLTGKAYPYIEPLSIDNEISKLLSVGQPSVRHSAIAPLPPVQLLLLDIIDPELSAWHNRIDPCFPYRPTVIPTGQPCTFDIITIQPIPITSIYHKSN